VVRWTPQDDIASHAFTLQYIRLRNTVACSCVWDSSMQAVQMHIYINSTS
jgi:hypothetical protein